MSKPIQIATAAYGYNDTEHSAGFTEEVLYVLLDDCRIFRTNACFSPVDRSRNWIEVEGPWCK